ncbi:MAG: thioredoxin [Bacteroidales bacterium]
MRIANIYILSLTVIMILVGCRKTNENSDSNTNIKQTTMGAISLTKAEFLKKVANYETDGTEWKYLGDKPAVIDFYADWCGPCRSMAPIIEEAAKEFQGKIDVYKVNVDNESELASVFKVQSIPTFIFIPMTGAPIKIVGGMSKADITTQINNILK